MSVRITFGVPDEPTASLLSLSERRDSRFTEALHKKLFDYFVSSRQGQTAMLPRNLVQRTIEAAIINLCQNALLFPIFGLEHNKKKFVRCCYRKVWRALLREWQARLVLAVGKSPADVTLPRHAAPWVDLPNLSGPTAG